MLPKCQKMLAIYQIKNYYTILFIIQYLSESTGKPNMFCEGSGFSFLRL